MYIYIYIKPKATKTPLIKHIKIVYPYAQAYFCIALINCATMENLLGIFTL